MMGSLRNRFICLTTLIAVLVIVVCKIEIIAVEPVSPLALKTIGVKECAACHSVPSPIYQQLGITTFVRLVEASEWLRKDKHAHAYELVRQDLSDEENQAADRKSNARSIEICKKLGWTIGDGKFEKQCLTCHAGLDHRTPPAQINLSMLQFGVQCEACHGAGADYSRLKHPQRRFFSGCFLPP